MTLKGKISIPVFQVFYVSKEASSCPLIADVARFGKKLTDSGLKQEVPRFVALCSFLLQCFYTSAPDSQSELNNLLIALRPPNGMAQAQRRCSQDSTLDYRATAGNALHTLSGKAAVA